MKHQELPIIGWREWIKLPEIGITKIKAKIDTGARTSSLHAFDIETFEIDHKPRVRFKIHPKQRDTNQTVIAEAQLIDERHVRSSSGQAELRPVILTEVHLMQKKWQVELTLTNRELMGFRMLLGRQAVREFFLIDPGKSYLDKNPRNSQK
ncbi:MULTISPECIES: ATP-dependent zinc protease [unclassified Okeania]|uniref:ATP-dependent zinc protease family protein n=1 Tax=unclassified Okeania TaxID=2634635 RepID=UPI0013B5FE80|nr:MULTISPECIES: ATP-dependent zinc protease [unclassified Okeania]NEP08317.1 ATP-dependent zinc protease [Okeania sp. SIO4D6]NEP73311.1 ATP-dependent zinc protease [Okeania sp. SIO2G5]NEP91665.1 ATP-dependent zinc protease [Okeania sp. SIO2F5]NEQ94700.1 ATP-dependent zinc protease [Okeania sp. SIO2G4]NES75883.1 ATP-dependent zinc protease [Okeania sp. SIO1H4]